MMDDNQIAVLFVDIYDNHWSNDKKFNEYVLPEGSYLTAYIKICCVIAVRAYANREVDENKFTQDLIDSINEVIPNLSAQEMLTNTWVKLCEAHAINPALEFLSFYEFIDWTLPQI